MVMLCCFLFLGYWQEYNATVEFLWAPLLVESNSDDPVNHRLDERIMRPDSVLKHSSRWEHADILVFNSYLWWRQGPVKLLWVPHNPFYFPCIANTKISFLFSLLGKQNITKQNKKNKKTKNRTKPWCDFMTTENIIFQTHEDPLRQVNHKPELQFFFEYDINESKIHWNL